MPKATLKKKQQRKIKTENQSEKKFNEKKEKYKQI